MPYHLHSPSNVNVKLRGLMTDDPIIQELRKQRDKYAEKFDYNLDAMFDDLKKIEKKAKADGFQFVSLPPKKVKSSQAA